MTEDESRKEFIRQVAEPDGMSTALSDYEPGKFISDSTSRAFRVWQAAVEWATRAERERCAQRCEDIGNALDPHKWPTPHRLAEILREEAND